MSKKARLGTPCLTHKPKTCEIVDTSDFKLERVIILLGKFCRQASNLNQKFQAVLYSFKDEGQEF